jgi:carboxyl-terminal processing protease
MGRTSISHAWRRLAGFGLTAAACLALGSAEAATPPAPASDSDQAYQEMERLTEVMLLVRRHYAEEKTYQQIVSGALQGMLNSLDPHSCYMEPEAYEEMQDDTSGRYGGIGIHIGMKDETLTVIAPIEGTPAYRAGLLSGDRIVGIDGTKTAGLVLRDAVKKLRGEKGTKVVLTIQRSGEEKTREVAIVRDDIEVLSVRGDTVLESDVGYVRVTQFSGPTAEALDRAVEGLMKKGIKALVLDLRNNPGGLLDSAIRVSEEFLRKGEMIVSVQGRDQRGPRVKRTAEGTPRCPDLPMAVLINGGSASASEIVAGALRDNGRAVLVGETTFGKASVQSVIPLKSDEKAAIRLTTAHYYTPSGSVIQDKGIEPDIRVYVPPDEWRKVLIKRAKAENAGYFTEADEKAEDLSRVSDRPLQRAVDLLHAILVFRPGDSG